jgi:hypothetical protein
MSAPTTSSHLSLPTFLRAVLWTALVLGLVRTAVFALLAV